MTGFVAGPHAQTSTQRPGGAFDGSAPRNCWYAAAGSAEVGRALTAVQVLDHAIVLFRAAEGTVAALDDCCAHRPYPLSEGRLVGNTVRCGLCGFTYDASGACVEVPTQDRVPVGAATRAFPVVEAQGIVWVWPGVPGSAAAHHPPEVPWPASPEWATVGAVLPVDASFLLLHESFADVTKIPVLAPEIAPAALGTTPPLEVVVTQTTVTLGRDYPPAPLPDWQARALSVPAHLPFAHRQHGSFLSPAAWVDHWDVQRADAGPTAEVHRLRFAQLVTPEGPGRSRLTWRVSRDFALEDAETSALLAAMFGDYYRRLAAALGRMQAVLDRDGMRGEVNVSADEAAVRVRGIVRAMLDTEGRPRNAAPSP